MQSMAKTRDGWLNWSCFNFENWVEMLMFMENGKILQNIQSLLCCSLCNPKPDPFQHVPRMPLGPVCVRSVQCGLTGEQVHLRRRVNFGALEDFPKQVEREINGNTDVGGDEVIAGPWLEDVETVEDDDDGEEEKSSVGCVRLKGRFENKRVTVYTLCFEGFVELNVRYTYADPGEEVGDRGQILEPLEHDGRSGGATEVG